MYKYLFKYQEYIDSVCPEHLDNDIKNILEHKRLSFVLNEGLIKTTPVDKAINILEKRYPMLEFSISDETCILISTSIHNHLQKHDDLSEYTGTYVLDKPMKVLINNLGYYIAGMITEGKTFINNEWDSADWVNGVEVENISIEPKYDIEVTNIPEYLYHATLKKNTKSIEKKGLIPRSNNKILNHPDRIYLALDILTAKQFTNYFNGDWVIYRVETKDIGKLYRDVNWEHFAFYTLENIKPDSLEMILPKK
jgi:hypothetical protein